MTKIIFSFNRWRYCLLLPLSLLLFMFASASSHREAPLIANDPLADNTDVYAFRSPDDTTTATLIANYITFELLSSDGLRPSLWYFALSGLYVGGCIFYKDLVYTTGDDLTQLFTFHKWNAVLIIIDSPFLPCILSIPFLNLFAQIKKFHADVLFILVVGYSVVSIYFYFRCWIFFIEGQQSFFWCFCQPIQQCIQSSAPWFCEFIWIV